MAPTSTNASSSLALALAGMTESVKIPQPRDTNLCHGRESFASVAAKSLPTKPKTSGLPTPPNSISPSLPPQTYSLRPSNDPPTPPAAIHVDSDIDLEEAVEHAKAQDSPQRALTARRLRSLESPDAVGDITPTMLAKHHLPTILLDNGPLAIRFIMAHLTHTVPGFSGIPPAKARRIVVGALEGRGSDGQPGSLNDEVTFEKVGWGRWEAQKRHQPPPEVGAATPSLKIPRDQQQQDRSCYGSIASDISIDSAMEDVSVQQHEADKMSMDGQICTSPIVRAVGQSNADLDDATDEEDWASIGAAALRQASCPMTGGLLRPHQRRQHSHADVRGRGRGAITKQRSSSNFAKSVPTTNVSLYGKQQRPPAAAATKEFQDLVSASEGLVPDIGLGTQDREAVEALLKLSSV